MIIHYDVIPISFFPGAGGHMLMNILNQAKLKSNKAIPFSTHGNAHEIDYETSPKFFTIQRHEPGKDPDRDITEDLISSIKKIKIIRPSRTPYFALYHGENQEHLSNYFYKTITISYDDDDFKTILALYHKKLHVDHWKSDDKICVRGDADNTVSVQEWQKLRIHEIKVHQDGYNFNGKRCLNVRFKELNSLPTNILFEKLSNFTKIPYDNFNDSNLLKWREINAKVSSEYEWFL